MNHFPNPNSTKTRKSVCKKNHFEIISKIKCLIVSFTRGGSLDFKGMKFHDKKQQLLAWIPSENVITFQSPFLMSFVPFFFFLFSADKWKILRSSSHQYQRFPFAFPTTHRLEHKNREESKEKKTCIKIIEFN